MNKKTTSKISPEKLRKFYEELVPVMLIKDNHKYKDDLTVTVNGTNYQIQRGVQVLVPRKVALTIERSKKQELEAEAYMESLKG